MENKVRDELIWGGGCGMEKAPEDGIKRGGHEHEVTERVYFNDFRNKSQAKAVFNISI